MNIAMISTQFAKIGGVENVMREIAKRLSKRHNIYLITRERKDNTQDFEKFWKDVWVIPNSETQKKYKKSKKQFEDFVVEKNIDILHFHNTTPFGPFIFNELRHKSIITLHGTVTGFYRDMKSWRLPLGWLFEEMVLNSAEVVTSITNSHLEDFILSKPVELIRNGVDLDRFNPKKFSRRRLRKKYGFSKFTILFLSKMMKNKGGDYFIEAARKLPEFQFVLAGDGPDRERVEAMAPSNVKCMGRVSEEEKLELYAAADIFVLPTISEGFPLVILEAMAMGLPIISTNIWGIEEVMKKRECAILVPPKDSDALVNAIRKLESDSQLRKTMGKSGRTDVEKEFSWDTIALSYEKLFINLKEKLTNQKVINS